MEKQPLSVVFVWHPSDEKKVKPIVEYCNSLLSRDITKPFSRSMNLPIFYYTTYKKSTPSEVDIDSEKVIVFIFISGNQVIEPDWVSYINKLYKKTEYKVIPIAIDEYAFSISKDISASNFIRLYELNNYINEKSFIYVAHEIYRYALNDTYREDVSGKDNALKIFLSHAKDGKNGIMLARNLKEFIDNSNMKNFFDATDIAPGYKFDEEIKKNIEDSSMILIRSDIYCSRYWCQKEILTAKELNRPMIIVDVIEEYEDRNFPFASNLPEIRVKLDGTVEEYDMLRILVSILLETIRFLYAKQKLNMFSDIDSLKVKKCYRPPEVSDIGELFKKSEGDIKANYDIILYPEPPIYSEESDFLDELGIKVRTPLTYYESTLRGKKIGISISEPEDTNLVEIGQPSSYIYKLSQDLARYLLARKATLVYGGDLRKGGFTEFLFEEAKILQSRLLTDDIFVENYISWPIYVNDTEEVKLWKMKYNEIAKMIEVPYESSIESLIINKTTFLPPNNSQNLYVWSKCLTKMRNDMIDKSDVRICAGGRITGYKGIMPGVLEEILIAIEKDKPIYLLGGFGGVTSEVCNIIQHKRRSSKLSNEWQINHNLGYKDMLELYKNYEKKDLKYDEIIKTIEKFKFNNGLSDSENIRLFNTVYIDEAISLILKGINNI